MYQINCYYVITSYTCCMYSVLWQLIPTFLVFPGFGSPESSHRGWVKGNSHELLWHYVLLYSFN